MKVTNYRLFVITFTAQITSPVNCLVTLWFLGVIFQLFVDEYMMMVMTTTLMLQFF